MRPIRCTIASRRLGAPALRVGRTAVLLLSLTLAASACPPPAPVVTQIEIVPGTVAIGADPTQTTTFVLEARLWSGLPSKRSSILESAGVKLKWSVNPSGSWLYLVGSPTGYHATLRIDPGASPTGTVTVRAQAGGIGAVSEILASAPSGDDLPEATYAAGLAPDAVVARGLRTSADNPCAVWLPPAMARLGRAGAVTNPCGGDDAHWGLAVLDPAHAMAMYDVPWTSGPDKVPAPTPTPIRSMPVAVRIFIGGGTSLVSRSATLQSFSLAEIDDANTVFTDNRVGIKLDPVDVQIVPPPTPGVEVDILSCAEGDLLTSGHDHSPAMLHIYLVDGTGGADGFTCPGSKARPQPVIYLNAAHSGTILLHEVGHALGLDLPRWGHTDDLPGFDPANVMASGYADTDDVWRRRLTVGQVLRMNADSASWLNSATDVGGKLLRDLAEPRLGCQCGYDDPAGRCPRLVDDVAQPRGGLGSLSPWHCNDEIQLPALDPGEQPLALIAGRRWRTPPTECRLDLPGKETSHGKADFIQSDNLTRAGGCASWVAVFFLHHEPIFRDLELMPGVWSDGADSRVLDRPLKPRRPVTVEVHYDLPDKNKVTDGITDAQKVYGDDNRAGIVLSFTRDELAAGTKLPSPCFAATIPGALSICYSSAASETIPQLIGAELGLFPLTPPEKSDAAFAGNAFQPAPGTGDKLTLGQVFRIHSALTALTTGDFPPCGSPSSPCPLPRADIQP